MIALKCVVSKENINNYLKDFSDNLHTLRCPHCDMANIVKFGFYSRTITLNEETYNINIQRVLCKSCGMTHALFPINLIPYLKISLDDVLVILFNLNENEIDKADYQAYDLRCRYNFWKRLFFTNKKGDLDITFKAIKEKIYINEEIRITLEEVLINFLILCSSFNMCFLQVKRRSYKPSSGKLYEVFYAIREPST